MVPPGEDARARRCLPGLSLGRHPAWHPPDGATKDGATKDG